MESRDPIPHESSRMYLVILHNQSVIHGKLAAAIAVQRGAADTTPQHIHKQTNSTILTLAVETPTERHFKIQKNIDAPFGLHRCDCRWFTVGMMWIHLMCDVNNMTPSKYKAVCSQ